jgi:hypothetical protein
MRVLVIGALCFALVGCGLARQRERQELLATTTAQVKVDAENCNQTYPKSQKTAVVRAQCIAAATAPIRPLTNYPDLYDQETANRNMLAERWQTGKITQLEYEAQFSEMHSQIVAEEQRRNLANRSVNAQETAATAALLSSGPTVCNRVGNTTICN